MSNMRDDIKRRYPDNTEAWYSGYIDYLSGLSEDDCPYAAGTADAASWLAGWIKSEEDEELKIDEENREDEENEEE